MNTDFNENNFDRTSGALASLGDELEQAISQQIGGAAGDFDDGPLNIDKRSTRRSGLALATVTLLVITAAAVVVALTTSSSGEQAVLSASPHAAEIQGRAMIDPSDSGTWMSGDEFAATLEANVPPLAGTDPACVSNGTSGVPESGDKQMFTCTLARAPHWLSNSDKSLAGGSLYVALLPEKEQMSVCKGDPTGLVWNCSLESSEGKLLSRGENGEAFLSKPGD